MAIFTSLNKEDIINETKELWNITSLVPINGWTDNSVYYFQTDEWNKYIYKLYEWKFDYFINRLLAIHKRIDNILTHKPLKKVTDKVSQQTAIIFNFLNNTGEYNIWEILEYINVFHKSLNKERKQTIVSKNKYLYWIEKEMQYFISKIKNKWYIDLYSEINLSQLTNIYTESLSKILMNKDELRIWLIHNDLNKWNIINKIDWVEFIDLDGVNKNLILKDYIIFIIRFDIYDKLDEYFIKNQEGYYIIGNEKVSEWLISNLYKVYSIYLILNMIYYIWYDKKDVKEEMYQGDNQSWQEIYKNLKKNNIL